MRVYFLLMMMSFMASVVHGQSPFWSDTFEDAGAPSNGTRTPSVTFSCGGPPSTSYFFRTTASGVNLQNSPFTYSNLEGVKFWALEDVDTGPTCTNASMSPSQTITWTNINISGRTNLQFKGLFAAASLAAGSLWEGSISFPSNYDFLIVEYRIDAGAWNKALAFYASTTSNAPDLKLDTNNDLLGDGTGLTYSFTEFTASLPGTGTTLELRFNASSNGTSTEEMAIDNFRLLGTVVLPVQWKEVTAKSEGEATRISWTTTQESNTASFTVQHSLNGLDWNDIGHLPAAGNSNTEQKYSLLHTSPASGKNWYRIKQIDLDGKFTFSNDQVLFKQVVLPRKIVVVNPVRDGVLHLQQLMKESDIIITDQQGRVLFKRSAPPSELAIPIHSWKRGIYLVRQGEDVEKIVIAE